MYLKTVFRSIADLLLPRHCGGCGCRLAVNEPPVCARCMVTIHRLRSDTGAIYRCLEDFAANPRLGYVGAFTIYRRKSAVAHMVHNLKYYHNWQLGHMLGQLAATQMLTEGAFENVDCLVPIPISWLRRLQRGYNQAELIAQGISDVTGIPVSTDILRRRHHTESQTHFEFLQRLGRQEGNFALCEGAAEKLTGKNVMLVDDVITTGATMRAATSELLKADVSHVGWFAWSLTV